MAISFTVRIKVVAAEPFLMNFMYMSRSVNRVLISDMAISVKWLSGNSHVTFE